MRTQESSKNFLSEGNSFGSHDERGVVHFHRKAHGERRWSRRKALAGPTKTESLMGPRNYALSGFEELSHRKKLTSEIDDGR